MATILIIESHPEVHDLLHRIVRRLGHDGVVDRGRSDVDAILVEPAVEGGLEAARSAKEASGAPVVCVSIYPPSEDALALEPVAYVLKPFSLVELERALVTAVEQTRRSRSAV